MNNDRPERRLGPNWPKSDFDKLCAEHGGPADLGITVEKNIFRGCCGEFPLGRVLPILLQFATDETTARRHWPWAAFAIDQYHFEIKERAKYKDELKPKEIHGVIKEIQRDAHDLRSALTRLQTLAFRLHEHSAPLLRPHLSWLDEFISQAVGGRISNEVTDNDITVFMEKMTFLKRLAEVEEAAKIAAKRVNVDLLKRKRGQSNPALPNFVWRCEKIWKSMTGRQPSARRVEKRSKSDDPDFVILVKALAKIGNSAEPSRKAIETAEPSCKAIETALRSQLATD